MSDLGEQILGPLARRYGTATVLFHHAVAERLGLGPTDHKCLDLLLDRGAMTGSQLAAVTGLTSGAVTGVVARLERAGRVRREPDPTDGRKQVLRPVPEGLHDVEELFAGVRAENASLLDGFDEHQLDAVAEFLIRATAAAYRRSGLLRGEVLAGGRRA